MQILFIAAADPWSLLVAWVTRSPWSHVAIAFEDGATFESRALRGVYRSSLDAHVRHLRWTYRWEVANMPGGAVDVAAARAWCESQVGQAYDWLALVNFLLPWFARRLDVRSHWFCSEFAAQAAQQAGAPLLREDDARISPAMLYLSPLLTTAAAGRRSWRQVLASIFGARA